MSQSYGTVIRVTDFKGDTKGHMYLRSLSPASLAEPTMPPGLQVLPPFSGSSCFSVCVCIHTHTHTHTRTHTLTRGCLVQFLLTPPASSIWYGSTLLVIYSLDTISSQPLEFWSSLRIFLKFPGTIKTVMTTTTTQTLDSIKVQISQVHIEWWILTHWTLRIVWNYQLCQKMVFPPRPRCLLSISCIMNC